MQALKNDFKGNWVVLPCIKKMQWLKKKPLDDNSKIFVFKDKWVISQCFKNLKR